LAKSPYGIKVDPERIKALVDLPIPLDAGKLMHFIHATNWIRQNLVNYAQIMKPLQDRLNVALGNGKRTSRRAQRIILTATKEYVNEFELAKEMLQHVIIHAHPRPDNTFRKFMTPFHIYRN
jgi:hypothetical protein